ncbi:MAG: MarR family winged helix-turn-helix transcriptional regulator [Gammaproteobacteria bacterium]
MSSTKTATNKNARTNSPHSSESDLYAVEEQVGHLLRRAHQRHCAIFTDRIGKALTPVQFAALSMIAQRGNVSQNHLGRLIAMDPATIQGVVGRLAERNLIKSKADPDDRRRQLWTLTAKGTKLLAELVPVAESISAETLEPLSARERQSFMKLLAKLS